MPGDLDDSRCCGSPRAHACNAAVAGAAAGAASCELLREAAHCGRGGRDGQVNLDPALGAGELQAEACALHAARRAVLESGGPLGGSGGGSAVGGGAGAAPALAVDPRKDSQPDDLTLFEVD